MTSSDFSPNKQEGYVKFSCSREDTDALRAEDILELNTLRALLLQLNLIGETPFVLDPDKGPELVGFGNLSKRGQDPNTFIISGTRTGGLHELGPEHYALVTSCDINRNTLHCKGRINASAESFSHAAVYRACPEVQIVVHIHHKNLWEKLCGSVPTSAKEAQYGTPEIARDIEQLLAVKKARAEGLVAMGGHEEGIIFFGKSIEEIKGTMRRVFTAYPEMGLRF